MDTGAMLNILGLLLGPLLGIQTQKFIEKNQEKRKFKIFVFRTLMATRNERLGHRHVEALNSIDLAYRNEKKEKKVIDAWRQYHSVLHDNEMAVNDSSQWNTKRESAFVDLLYEMSQCLGYSYNRLEIEKGGYSPQWHGEQNAIQDKINKGLADVLHGEKSLSVILKSSDLQQI